jgi:hypothetical protein
MDFISLGEEKFGKVRTVLAGDSGNKCSFHCNSLE